MSRRFRIVSSDNGRIPIGAGDSSKGVNIYSTDVAVVRDFTLNGGPTYQFPNFVNLHSYCDKFSFGPSGGNPIKPVPVITDREDAKITLDFGQAYFEQTGTYLAGNGFNLQFTIDGVVIPFDRYGVNGAKLIIESRSPLWKVGEVEYNGGNTPSLTDTKLQFRLYYETISGANLVNTYMDNSPVGVPLTWTDDPRSGTSIHEAFVNLNITILYAPPNLADDDEDDNGYGYGS